MSKRVNRDDVDKFHDYGLYIPSRTIYLGSVNVEVDGNEAGVDASMAERFIKNITILEGINKEPITIVANNPGGDWYHGMAIHDAIKAAQSHVTMQVYGCAMSMGAVILQAADERVMSPYSRLMIHYGTNGMDSNHSKTFSKVAKENDKINIEMENLLLAKIAFKHPTFRLKKLQDLLNFDSFLTVSEAISLGLADKELEQPHE